VAVRDSGPGIAAEALPHVFDRFYKSDESRGAGLGLAIAKSLVVAHGGEISVTSQPGQGTEMRFTLPVSAE
jgi:signal transduction histidine kinase